MEANKLKEFWSASMGDQRLNVYHLTIMTAVLLVGKLAEGGGLAISRKRIMQAARIGSISTYHKCLKELVEFGYVEYRPSYHPGIRSIVILIEVNDCKF